jgi:ribose transport system permease protein
MTTTSTPLRSRIHLDRRAIPYLALAALYVVTIVIAPGYRQPAQVATLLQLATILGFVAVGQTLVILIGGIDLSVGATLTLANMVSAAVLNGQNSRIAAAFGISLAIGMAIGLVNGLVITRLNVPDLVATLATMSIVTGVGYLVTGGSPKGSSAPGLSAFMTHRFAGVLTGGLVAWFALAVVVSVVLGRTTAGRRVYAIGLNREASLYAAVPVKATIVGMYVASGAFAAIAGMLMTGYLGSSYLGSGTTYQLSTIAAVVLGGANIFGGSGSYAGTVAGVGITVVLLSILQVIGIPQAGQNIAYGIVILLMLLAFTSRQRTA